jgi:hypothetical protein
MTVLLGGEIVQKKDMGMGGGPTFFGVHGELLVKSAKRKKLGKMGKKIKKMLEVTPSSGTVWGRDFEIACAKDARAELLKSARNPHLSRAERQGALRQLDSCACGERDAAMSAMVTKSAKRLPKETRERLMWDVYHSPDLDRRVRAMDLLLGALG